MYKRLREETMTDKEDNFPVLMERPLKRERGEKSLVNIVIQIGYPKWKVQDIEACCPVAIRGDIGRVQDIVGIDPIDAMKNAITFIDSYFKHNNEKIKVYWPDGEEY
jgi:hypothetical protein